MEFLNCILEFFDRLTNLQKLNPVYKTIYYICKSNEILLKSKCYPYSYDCYSPIKLHK